MPTIRGTNYFYPLNDHSEHDVVPFFSLDLNSGNAGTLVKITTGAANPQVFDGWSSQFVGTNVANTVSYRYESKAKVTATVSGDTHFNALGLTLYATLEFDENSQPLRYNIPRAKEIGAVLSGENVPVATRGLFGLWGNYIDQSLGSVQPGNLVVVSRSGGGLLAAVDPSNTTNFNVSGTNQASWHYEPKHVVGKWISSLPTATNTGLQNEFATQGGYALFLFDSKA